MATGAGRHTGMVGFTTAAIMANESPAMRDKEARGEACAPPIIEISDKDYRSFCFPCHALEETPGCNAGY